MPPFRFDDGPPDLPGTADARSTGAFMATGQQFYATKRPSLREVELPSIAFDASCMHKRAPGWRQSLRATPDAGATDERIAAVREPSVVQACVLRTSSPARTPERHCRAGTAP